MLSLSAMAFCLSPLFAQVTANFKGEGSTENPNMSDVDAFPGQTGLGWTEAWGTRFAPAVAVVAGGGAWSDQHRLQVKPNPAMSGNSAVSANVYRSYESHGTLEITKPFSISFKVSIDEMGNFLNTPTNFFYLGQNSSTSPNSTDSSNWYIVGHGGGEPGSYVGDTSAKQGQWNLYSGKRGAGSSLYLPTGILLAPNVIYTFKINLDPFLKQYSVSISDGTHHFEEKELPFNSKEPGFSTRLTFAENYAAGEGAVYSIGDISLSASEASSTSQSEQRAPKSSAGKGPSARKFSR